MATKIKNHTAVAGAQLTRILEAVARLEWPTDEERAFRVAIMKRQQLVADLPEIADEDQKTRALEIRNLESACKIDHPNPDERAYRLMVMGTRHRRGRGRRSPLLHAARREARHRPHGAGRRLSEGLSGRFVGAPGATHQRPALQGRNRHAITRRQAAAARD